MSDNRIMIIGEKETFLTRVLVKKVNEAGADCVFVPWTIDSINASWDGICLVAVYMDEHRRPSGDVIHFVKDKLAETGASLVPIGGEEEVRFICDRVPGELIFKTFLRPIDNDEFVHSVVDHHGKVVSGHFKKSILIVDDDPSYMGLVREWLKDTYKVSMANSGLQAIKWLGKNKADLILLDHEMPITSGPQVLEMLRHDEETKNIPVIFLTGKSDKQSVMEVVALKPEGYFLKNISREELLEKLNEFFVLGKKLM